MTELERALAALRELYRRRAGRVVPLLWGELLVTDDLPRAWDANLALVDRWDASAATLADEVDRVSDAEGFRHRKAIVHDQELGERLWPQLPISGWPFHDRFLVMVQRRDVEGVASVRAEEVGIDAFSESRERASTLDPETTAQLVELGRREHTALDVRYFGIVADGTLVSRCQLFVHPGGVAQVEDVATDEAHRSRGHARATVQRAAEEARAAGADLVFLVTAEDDWPQHLYRKLGFETVGIETTFGRP